MEGPLRVDIDVNFAVLNLDRIGLQLLIRMVYRCAGLRIPFPGVPRADDFPLFHHALSQRATLVQALIVHGMELAPDVGDADHFSVTGEVPRFVGGG